MTKIFVVIQGTSDGGGEEGLEELNVLFHEAFFSKEKAEARVLELSKAYWSNVSYPYAGREDAWYANQNFFVKEVDLF